MTPVARGVMGRVWSLETDRGRWAVKALFDWAEAAGAETDVALQEAASAAGVALPRSVRSPAGAVVETVAGRRCGVHAWVELPPPPSLPVDPPSRARVGTLLAKLHRLAMPAPAAIAHWFTRQPPTARWSELLASATEAVALWAPALREAMPAIAELSWIAARPPAEPAILCHCDLIPENVRPGPGALVVIDREHPGALPRGWELGYVVAAWCAGQRDATGARAYRKYCGAVAGPDLGIFAAAASAWLKHGRPRGAGAGGRRHRPADVRPSQPDGPAGPPARPRQVHIVVTATALCINGGGNHPKAVNKESVSAASDLPVQNGKADFELSVTATFSPSCSPPMTVAFTDITVTDTTNNISAFIPGPI